MNKKPEGGENMKKVYAFLLAVILLLSVLASVACAGPGMQKESPVPVIAGGGSGGGGGVWTDDAWAPWQTWRKPKH